MEEIATLDLDGTLANWNIEIAGNYAYVCDGGLRVIDITNPSNPLLIANFTTAKPAFDLSLEGDFVYIAGSETGFGPSKLQVIDISDLNNPFEADSIDIGEGMDVNASRGIDIYGDVAYVAMWYGGLETIEVRWNQVNQYRSLAVAQSSIIYPLNLLTGYTSHNATLTVDHELPANTAINYYISSDDGSTWVEITPNILIGITAHDNI